MGTSAQRDLSGRLTVSEEEESLWPFVESLWNQNGCLCTKERECPEQSKTLEL